MDFELIFVVVSSVQAGIDAAIAEPLAAHQLESVSAEPSNAVDRLQELTGGARAPSVVILGPGVVHPAALARQMRAVWPMGQLLFVPHPDQYDVVVNELKYVPMLGPNWSLVELSDPHLGEKIVRAGRASRQRARLRTTLDRANVRLTAPKPIDSIEYRQSVISEHYLASLLQHSSDAIFSLDARNNVMYWSSGAEQLFRFRSRPSQAVAELPFWSGELDRLLEQIHAGESPLKAEMRIVLDNRTLHLAVSLARVQDEQKTFIGTSITVRDISDVVRAIETERAGRVHAERLGRLKDEFLALLSHELRTPLSAVIGRTQLLRMQHHESPELQRSLEVIERNAKMQAKLIEDLLDVSLILTGKLTLEKHDVDLLDLLRATLDSVRTLADNKHIELVMHNALAGATVQGDAYRLQQVFNNILSNAIKFTPAGGQVALSAAHGAGGQVQVVIADTGCGIAAQFLPHVFEKFGQEDASTTRRHGGLGLGLSIAKQLTELHDGTISVDSPGRGLGTSFTVTLPLSRGASMRPALPLAPPGASSLTLTQRRILVVEDVADTRALIEDVLTAHGAQVVMATSAARALELLRVEMPDILVSDIGMPDMDGYQLIAEVRRLGMSAATLPAVALTAFAGVQDRQRAFDAGFQAHVSKPNVVTELVANLVEVLGTPGSAA